MIVVRLLSASGSLTAILLIDFFVKDLVSIVVKAPLNHGWMPNLLHDEINVVQRVHCVILILETALYLSRGQCRGLWILLSIKFSCIVSIKISEWRIWLSRGHDRRWLTSAGLSLHHFLRVARPSLTEIWVRFEPWSVTHGLRETKVLAMLSESYPLHFSNPRRLRLVLCCLLINTQLSLIQYHGVHMAEY